MLTQQPWVQIPVPAVRQQAGFWLQLPALRALKQTQQGGLGLLPSELMSLCWKQLVSPLLSWLALMDEGSRLCH